MYTVFVYFGRIAIISFKDQSTRDVYDGVNSKAARHFPRQLWGRISRKLDALNAAVSLNDLRGPGNQLEKLTDDLEGYWSIRVNDQYRICFQFGSGNASNVFCQGHPLKEVPRCYQQTE